MIDAFSSTVINPLQWPILRIIGDKKVMVAPIILAGRLNFLTYKIYPPAKTTSKYQVIFDLNGNIQGQVWAFFPSDDSNRIKLLIDIIFSEQEIPLSLAFIIRSYFLNREEIHFVLGRSVIRLLEYSRKRVTRDFLTKK